MIRYRDIRRVRRDERRARLHITALLVLGIVLTAIVVIAT